MKEKYVPDLRDSTFISYLAFLTDLTNDLNLQILKLQCSKQIITMMYNSVKSFKCKLFLLSKQLAGVNFAHLTILESRGRI